ncbi:MAG: hypothetical protein F4059_04145 [Gemmatimonadetes bacterium]|nr:hypothetical protein [Gemmatimonadota bacterium]
MSRLRFRKIAVIARAPASGSGGRIGAACREIAAVAGDFGASVAVEPALAAAAPGLATVDLRAHSVDLVISLGGDGTLLRTARLLFERDIPVLGINFGSLGFLTSVSATGIGESLRSVLDGDFFVERRQTLAAEIRDAAGTTRLSFAVLNAAVVHKAGAAQVVHLDMWVGLQDDLEEIGSFSGDGVILSTPTGSTAYSLSAGGPIIVPQLNCFLVTPILPHTLALRPVVVPGDEEITVAALDGRDPLYLTVDGQEGGTVRPNERVVVRMGAFKVPLVRLPGHSFFATLRRKLSWAARPAGDG